jgi:hypothetical protein
VIGDEGRDEKQKKERKGKEKESTACCWLGVIKGEKEGRRREEDCAGEGERSGMKRGENEKRRRKKIKGEEGCCCVFREKRSEKSNFERGVS